VECRLIFHPDKSGRKKRNSRKQPFKTSKIPKFENVVICGKYGLTKFENFLIIVLRAAIATATIDYNNKKISFLLLISTSSVSCIGHNGRKSLGGDLECKTGL
jgi:hypothetical protein